MLKWAFLAAAIVAVFFSLSPWYKLKPPKENGRNVKEAHSSRSKQE
jgi:hypothetical protein